MPKLYINNTWYVDMRRKTTRTYVATCTAVNFYYIDIVLLVKHVLANLLEAKLYFSLGEKIRLNGDMLTMHIISAYTLIRILHAKLFE